MTSTSEKQAFYGQDCGTWANASKTAFDIIKKCYDQHEQYHIDHQPLKCKCPYEQPVFSADGKDADEYKKATNEYECEAYKATISCLRSSSRRECKELDLTCKTDVEKAITNVQNQLQERKCK